MNLNAKWRLQTRRDRARLREVRLDVDFWDHASVGALLGRHADLLCDLLRKGYDITEQRSAGLVGLLYTIQGQKDVVCSLLGDVARNLHLSYLSYIANEDEHQFRLDVNKVVSETTFDEMPPTKIDQWFLRACATGCEALVCVFLDSDWLIDSILFSKASFAAAQYGRKNIMELLKNRWPGQFPKVPNVNRQRYRIVRASDIKTQHQQQQGTKVKRRKIDK